MAVNTGDGLYDRQGMVSSCQLIGSLAVAQSPMVTRFFAHVRKRGIGCENPAGKDQSGAVNEERGKTSKMNSPMRYWRHISY